MRYLPFTHASHFLKERDFGQKIEASFDFIRAHFKPLGRALLMIVLPAALVIGLATALMTLEWINNLKGLQGSAATVDKTNPWPGISNVFSKMFFSPAYLTIVFGGLILTTMLILTVYGYVTLRLETAPEQEITVSAVWRLVRQRFLGTVGALIGLGVGSMIVFFLVSMVAGVLSALLIGGSGGSRFMIGVAVVLVMSLVFGAFAYISIALSLFLIIWVRERLGFLATISRSFKLIWGKWWSTFGLLIVMLIISGVIILAITLLTSLISSPFAAATAGTDGLEGAARLSFLVATTLRSMASLVIYPLILLALAFQYFNLVERKEGESLHYLVDAIGQPAPEAAPQALRPDDEGEY
ncbi:hypothetical protein HMJ29_01820 [Hymenobacter taeanensis]|uniref:Glycerophosphoryl diester phosphodiesterase membrane domain-containing protein n=1 Tax=Hymenobacter taeanensis TaxID=2735321 RepID=A0A6M6BCK9_9BACT|nr:MULTISPECIES: hypothetical protein [Hymenobacter]QJX45739.1 hypothetical protein HMJ29_01820 [Hymenobacter taeanensis]UOQ79579.1 hypothetical protein MUN83_12030 [Hymenobacter sp. 5414T-23]